MSDRRSFLARCASAGIAATVGEALWNQLYGQGSLEAAESTVVAPVAEPITEELVKAAEALLGLANAPSDRALMLVRLEEFLASYTAIRSVALANQVQPAFRFSAILPGRTYSGSQRPAGVPSTSRPSVRRPTKPSRLAFLTVVELAELIRTREVSSTELTKLYLSRLEQYNPDLRCVITLTTARALRQAAEADREIAAGRRRGPLHGIPYGVKDTLAVPGYPTTWGAEQFRSRVLNTTATVVRKLDDAGAILVGKLAMGELGLSDRWFGGRTMNPWRPVEGASGSSSGSAAATAAGLVAFAIATETMGSILIPASRNGITALRPTFGRVSRTGAMTLSWSLDKIGPMARSVEDCAVVLETIRGPDGTDPTVQPIPYAWDPSRPLSSVRVGYFRAAFDALREPQLDAVLGKLSDLGVQLVAVDMPSDLHVNALLIIRVEAAAALDEVPRANGLGMLKDQGAAGWPNFLRAARFIPAHEYIQANRIRTQLMERMDAVFQQVDVVVAPPAVVVTVTNLTGHPCVVAPAGFMEHGVPVSIAFVGKPFAEARLCTVARAWQEATGWHQLHPAPFAD